MTTSELERPDAGESADSADADSMTLTVDGRDVTVDLPVDAGPAEAAAIASAIGAHLHDRAVAAAAAETDAGPDPADEWTLAGKLKSQGRRRWPSDVSKGEEWKAAARSFY